MRNLLAAALTAVLIGSPAGAATMVQSSASYAPVPGGFAAFDSSLGTLTSVTLAASTTDHRTAAITGPLAPGVKSPVPVNWSVNGHLDLTLFAFGGPSLSPLSVALNGSGSGTYAAPGNFDYAVTGSGLFNLDPSFFLLNGPSTYDFGINAVDPGLFDYSTDTMFSSSKRRANIVGFNGRCYDGTSFGGDACNSTTYTLTYNFTPLATSAVPEPGSWAMMLLGFLGVGMATRRRRAPAFA